MVHVIVYGNSHEQAKIEELIKNTTFELVTFQDLSKYQEERAFIYGNQSYGHAVAIICISGEEPIPFGVLSADINNKQLPIIVYVANNDKAREIQLDFFRFLEETNTQLKIHLKNCDSFQFREANYSIIYESAKDIGVQFIETINTIHSRYLKQPEHIRTIRAEANPPTEEQLEEKRFQFSRMEGFSNMANTLAEFRAQLMANKPTVSFFGTIFPPLTDKCTWAAELGEFNFIFGLGGADKGKSIEQQSVMYQFAYYAKQNGCNVYGTIPYGQVRWEESRDFSELEIKSCYITPQLQERMQAFKELSNLVIVGSTGTGTYEEVIDTLRTEPLTHIIIMNDDGGNTPLVQFLEKNKDIYPNCSTANTRDEFINAIQLFKWNYQKTNNAVKNNTSSSFYGSLSTDVSDMTSSPQSSEQFFSKTI